ncbi:MAG: SCO family protein, partial [Burkholderiales bacterium]
MKTFLAALLAGMVIALAGCGGQDVKPVFKLTDVTGASFGKTLELTDHNGKPRTLADFKGKVVTLFFGFTHCPDVCPTTLNEMAVVMKELGADAARVQVLFVSVDPERDTADVLKNYVPVFNPAFLGLTGSADEVARAAKEFKIFYQKQKLQGGAYTMDHSAGT